MSASACERDGAMWRSLLTMVTLAIVTADLQAEKRAEMQPAPFVLGSRYGRSPARMMAPRNDRFFMGSRYGKRSEIAPSSGPSEANAITGLGANAASGYTDTEPVKTMLCEYSGLSQYYRCYRFTRRTLLDSRTNEAESSEVE